MNSNRLNDILFVPGGPGFNSNPEKHLFAKLHDKFDGWNEPSVLRGLTQPPTFHDVCYDLKKKLSGKNKCQIIFHSFAAQYVSSVVKECADNISQIIFLTPGFDLYQADKNILSLSISDWEISGEKDKALDLTQRKNELPKVWNDKRLESLLIASSNPGLFLHYFNKKEAIAQYFAYIQGEYAFDFENFKSLRGTLPELPAINTDIPTTVIWGKHDPIVKKEEQQKYLHQCFPQARHITFEDSSHYPHIEETGNFFELLNS